MKREDEKLSLLLDDRVDAADVAGALDQVTADVNLQYRLRRYQMIGEIMRNELPPAIDTDFHARVMAQIRAEAGSGASAEAGRVVPLAARSWFRPLAGLAVAASVAIVTVVLWQPVQQQQGGAPESLANADQQMIQQLAEQQIKGGAVTVSSRVQDGGTRWISENQSPMLQQKLNAYLVNHTEYSNSMQGLIPQARVAGFDAQE
jgi:sigma-E factor negative regulatory protein RseA